MICKSASPSPERTALTRDVTSLRKEMEVVAIGLSRTERVCYESSSHCTGMVRACFVDMQMKGNPLQLKKFVWPLPFHRSGSSTGRCRQISLLDLKGL